MSLLLEENLKLCHEIRQAARSVNELLKIFSSREMSLAITNLEQCVMWAEKAIVLRNEKIILATSSSLSKHL